jgi:hypothetical protein
MELSSTMFETSYDNGIVTGADNRALRVLQASAKPLFFHTHQVSRTRDVFNEGGVWYFAGQGGQSEQVPKYPSPKRRLRSWHYEGQISDSRESGPQPLLCAGQTRNCTFPVGGTFKTCRPCLGYRCLADRDIYHLTYSANPHKYLSWYHTCHFRRAVMKEKSSGCYIEAPLPEL